MSLGLERERVLVYQEELRFAQLYIAMLQSELEDVKRQRDILLLDYTYEKDSSQRKRKRKRKMSIDDMFLLIDAIAESKASSNISLEEFFSNV